VTKHDSNRIELYTEENFLDAADCAGLVELIKGALHPSAIFISPSDTYDATFRTSRSCSLSDKNALVAKLHARIHQAFGLDLSFAETMEGQHYEVGQAFKPHTDFYKEYELKQHSTDRLGQRTWTFMIYVGEPEGGGETRFVDLALTIEPKRGRALLWNNLLPSGAPNPWTRHESLPVTAGTKTIITKWFRAPLQRDVVFSSPRYSWTQRA